VEDDPEVLTLCVDMLTELGYACATTTNAQAALELLSGEQPYDLLFSDVVMPGGMNGIELARRAQHLRPRLRLLLTSGYLGDDIATEPHDFPLVAKPYQRDTLAVRLREILDAPLASPRTLRPAWA
jgi:CheY-like chemotaxis protein